MEGLQLCSIVDQQSKSISKETVLVSGGVRKEKGKHCSQKRQGSFESIHNIEGIGRLLGGAWTDE